MTRLFKKHSFGSVTAFEMGRGFVAPPHMTVHVYLVDGLLIDSGSIFFERELCNALANETVQRVVLTHHHEDHSGNAAALQNRLALDVSAHPLTVEAMARRIHMRLYRHLVWGRAPRARLVAGEDVVETEQHRLQRIHTPGHCRDHCVYYEPQQGWLFAGDLYLAKRVKIYRTNERIDQQIESLQRVATLDFDRLFCAHRPVQKGGPKRIRAKLDYLQNLLGEVQRHVDQGETDRVILRRYARGELWSMRLLTQGDACHANLIRSALRAARRGMGKLGSDSKSG